MRLIFLGTGSAFTLGMYNFHSNMVLEKNAEHRLLIDCGSDARLSLFEQGLSHQDIEGVYISHLHADHAGGLEWLAFTTKFDPECEKPSLYVSENLLHNLWNTVLKGGLSSLENSIPELQSYFKVVSVKDEIGFFEWAGLKINLIKTLHTLNASGIMPSYGVWFTLENNLTVFITTDTQFFPERYEVIYKKSDIIFHDCETREKKSGVHSNYSELVQLDPAIKQKMWLYHYNDGELPNAKADGFRGFVKKGQCFDFNEPNTLI